MAAEPTPVPTQVKRPWRATVRTVFQFVVALASLLPFVVSGVYADGADVPLVVGQALAVAAAITRVMALPQVEAFLQRFLPFLAATPSAVRRSEAGHVSLLGLACIVFVLVLVAAFLV